MICSLPGPNLAGGADMTPDMGRRKCLAVLAGGLAWPLSALAQPAERVRRIGVLIYGGGENPASRAQVDALREGLQELGWVEGRNIKLELRIDSDRERIRARAEELVGSSPDVIVVNTNAATAVLQRMTQTVPIVFAGVG